MNSYFACKRVVIGSNPIVGSMCRCSSVVERLNELCAPVPQRSYSVDGEEIGYFAQNETQAGFACSSTDRLSRMVKNSVTSTKTNGRARILPPLSILVPGDGCT